MSKKIEAKELGIDEKMLPSKEASFEIETIQLFSFQFAKQAIEEGERGGIDIEAKKRKTQSGYDILTKIEVNFAYHTQRKIWCEAVFISAIKTSENFNEWFLNNVVAIIYSYLRPIMAQMTAMAKAPSLDLPPLSFERIEIQEWK